MWLPSHGSRSGHNLTKKTRAITLKCMAMLSGADCGPALARHWNNASCLLGCALWL